jgi:CoA:oxalate CoA-transferase
MDLKEMMMSLPLEGVKVLDLTHVMAGPFCTQVLGDLGAEVIKIERPGEGDPTRWMPPHQMKDQSLYFMALNRNKKSLTLNLKAPEGKDIFYALTRQADVVMNNFMPGTMEKMGLGYPDLKKINPKIVWASVTGYGQTGPYRERPSYDIIVQAMGGGMSYTGEPGRPPVRSGIPIGDLGGAVYAVIGILAALVSRSTTGEGRMVDISMLDVQVALHTYRAKYYFATGEVPQPVGTGHVSNVPLRAYRTKNSALVIEAYIDHFFRNLSQNMEMEHLADDPRFNTRAKRLENREALDAILEAAFLQKTTEEWLELFVKREVPGGPINTVDKTLSDPQVLSRDMVVEIDSPHTGKMKDVGSPLKFSGKETIPYRYPPALGEHTDEVLRKWLGYPDGKIAALRNSKVI